MHHIPPLGATDPNAPYSDGNPLLGQRGSRPSAETWNLFFAEMLNVLDAAGMTPDPEDQTQLAQAIMLMAVGGDMFKADNLAGLDDVAAARGNLGLGNNSNGRANLGILQRRGTSIASAATTDIGSADSHYVQVTGNDTITSLGTGTARDFVMVEFTGTAIITHHASNLILPGTANITTQAGDRAIFVRRGAAAAAQWLCLSYQRADGLPVVDKFFSSVTKQDIFTTTSTSWVDIPGLSVTVTPKRNNPVEIEAAINCAGSGGAGMYASYRILRDTTPIMLGTPDGVKEGVTAGVSYGSSEHWSTIPIKGVDAASGTAARTYKVQMRVNGGTGFINQSSIETNTASFGRAISTISAREL